MLIFRYCRCVMALMIIKVFLFPLQVVVAVKTKWLSLV